MFSPLFVVPQKGYMKAFMFKSIFWNEMKQLSEMHWAARFKVIGVNNFLLVISQVLTSSEAYSEPYQTSRLMEHFDKIVNGFQPLFNFAKRSIVYVWRGSDDASVVPLRKNKEVANPCPNTFSRTLLLISIILSVPISFPLNTLENRRFSGFFRGYKMEILAKSGLMPQKISKTHLS